MRLKASWVKSIDTFVVSQELSYSVNDQGATVVLDKDAESHIFVGLVEGDVVGVSLRASSGRKFSEPLVSSFTIPTEPVPASPTNLTFEVLEGEIVE